MKRLAVDRLVAVQLMCIGLHAAKHWATEKQQKEDRREGKDLRT